MKQLIVNFQDNVIGIEEFIKVIVPVLKNHKVEKLKENPYGAALYAIATNLIVGCDEETEKRELKFLEEKLKTKVTIKEVEGKRSITLDWDEVKYKKLTRQFWIAVKSEEQTGRLYTSALISLTSSIELFLAGMLHKFYSESPKSLDRGKRIKNRSEIKNENVDKKVERILRGSLKEWIEILKEELNLKIRFIELHLGELTEIFERRHRYIHSGGIVNDKYLQKVPEQYRSNLKKGELLITNYDYIVKTTRLTSIAFSMLGWELSLKLGGGIEEIEGQVVDTCFTFLENKNFESLVLLTSSAISDFAITPPVKALLEIFHWFGSELKSLLELDENDRHFYNPQNISMFKLAKNGISDESSQYIDSIRQAISEIKSEDFEEIKRQPIYSFAVSIRKIEDMLRNMGMDKYFIKSN